VTSELTVSGTHAFQEGQIVTFPDGTQHRIVSVHSPTSFGIGPELPEILSWRQRLWRHLTTTPNGDGTLWMTREYRS
jgi:hypothetical protein